MEQHADCPSATTSGGRNTLDLVSYWRPIVRGIARFVAALCSIWLSIAVVHSASSEFGSTRNALQSVRSSSNCLMIALIVWAGTSDWLLKVVRVDWRSWGYYRLAVLGLLSLNMVFAFRNVVYYPDYVVRNRWSPQELSSDGIDHGPNPTADTIDNFAARCCQALPPDARILFHGTRDVWVFAYEVYPRKVFRLPSEAFQQDTILQSRPWLQRFPYDPLDAFWHRNLPSSPEDRDDFIRAHGITHEVYYQADDRAGCLWKAVR